MPLQMRFYTHMCAQRSHVMCPWRSVKRTQPWWSDGSNSFLWPPVSFFQFLLQPFDTGSSLMPTDILIDSIQSSILEVMDTNEPILFTRSVKKTQVAWLWGVVSFVPHSRCTKGPRVQHGWFCRWITRWLVWFTAMVNAAPMVNPMVNPIPFPAQLEWGVRCAHPSASRTALIHRWHWEWWKTEEQQWHWEWDGRFVFAVLNSDLNWPFSFRDMGGSL